MTETRFFPFGAYEQLDAQQQAVVDSMLLSEVIYGTAKARVNPDQASELQHAFRAVHEAYLNSHQVTGSGHACLALNRDFLAGHPAAIEAVRDVLHDAGIQPQLWAQYTQTLDRMVALDGHPLKLSD